MGHYTEFSFQANLRKDTPSEVINLLNRVVNERDLGHDKVLFKTSDVFKPEFDHVFFKCDRWYMLFLSTNGCEGMKTTFSKVKNYYELSIHSEFKNYDDEVDYFMDWIKPFIVGRKKKQYVGYWKSESSPTEINLYINRN